MELCQTDEHDLGIALSLLKAHSKLDVFVPLTVNEEFIERYPGALDLPKSVGLSRSRFVELLGLSNCWVEKPQQRWVNVFKNWGLANFLNVHESTQYFGTENGKPGGKKVRWVRASAGLIEPSNAPTPQEVYGNHSRTMHRRTNQQIRRLAGEHRSYLSPIKTSSSLAIVIQKWARRLLAQNEKARLYEEREMIENEPRHVEMEVQMDSPLLVGEEGDESTVLSIFNTDIVRQVLDGSLEISSEDLSILNKLVEFRAKLGNQGADPIVPKGVFGFAISETSAVIKVAKKRSLGASRFTSKNSVRLFIT